LISVALLLLANMSQSSLNAQQTRKGSSVLIEQTRLDWDHSGNSTTFSLFRRPGDVGSDQPDRLVIKQAGKPDWSLNNRGDAWAPLSETGLPVYRKQAKRLFFVSAGSEPNARIYLVLKGESSGCCVGSLTVLTSGEGGTPKIVFHESSYEIHAITPTDGNALELIGRSSDSEVWATKNAQSYDPYRIYLFRGAQAAAYDLDLSRAYTESHYCQWHGPKYDERFVAVGPTTDSTHCRVMSGEAFHLYLEKHPQLFATP